MKFRCAKQFRNLLISINRLIVEHKANLSDSKYRCACEVAGFRGNCACTPGKIDRQGIAEHPVKADIARQGSVTRCCKAHTCFLIAVFPFPQPVALIVIGRKELKQAFLHVLTQSVLHSGFIILVIIHTEAVDVKPDASMFAELTTVGKCYFSAIAHILAGQIAADAVVACR